MIYPILLYGNPILKQTSKEVPKGSTEIENIVKNMFETMYAAQGIGLAAPQVGLSLRVFIMDSTPVEKSNEQGVKQAFINPIIMEEKGEDWNFEEGCLSIPGIRENVSRKTFLHIKYYDQEWKEYEQTYDGIKARIIQHEYDHLDGILFTDHLSPFKKQLLNNKLHNISKGKVDTDYKVKTPK